MKKIGLFIFLLSNTLSWGQTTLEKVETLIAAKKYNAAFGLLEKEDTSNEKPEIVLKKVDIALEFFVKSISHQLFAFKNLEAGENLLELRENGFNESFSMYSFAIDEILEKLIKKYPENYKLHQTLGHYYHQVHMIYGPNWLMEESAVLKAMYQHCTKATENNVGDYLTHYYIGYYHLVNSNYKDAVPAFLTSIELDSTYPTSSYNLSLCYFYQEAAQKGIPYALAAFKWYEDRTFKADAARVVAILYKEVDKFELALDYYRKSNTIEPNSYYTIYQLLELELEMGELKEARETASVFFELEPTNPQIYSELLKLVYQYPEKAFFLELMKEKAKVYKGKETILGPIYFYTGSYYLYGQENKKLAKANFLKAEKYFSNVFEEDHPVFDLIKEALKESE